MSALDGRTQAEFVGLQVPGGVSLRKFGVKVVSFLLLLLLSFFDMFARSAAHVRHTL